MRDTLQPVSVPAVLSLVPLQESTVLAEPPLSLGVVPASQGAEVLGGKPPPLSWRRDLKSSGHSPAQVLGSWQCCSPAKKVGNYCSQFSKPH